MQSLLKPSSSELNIALIDQLVESLYDGNNQRSHDMLNVFNEHPMAIMYGLEIFEKSGNRRSRIFGLNVIQKSVKMHWHIYPLQNRLKYRNFVIKMLLDYLVKSSAAVDDILVKFMDNIIIEIAKKDWPSQWPEFIPELLAACKTNDIICANNMVIINMVIEDVFENEQLLKTQQKEQMKPALQKMFIEIFQLCLMVLNSSQNKVLCVNTLKTIATSIKYLPKQLIFESPLIKILLFSYFPKNEVKYIVVRCLTCVAAINVKEDPPIYLQAIKDMMKYVVNKADIPDNLEFFSKLYQERSTVYRSYILFMANFFVTLLVNYGEMFDQMEDVKIETHMANTILTKISCVDDTEIFKITLEYWEKMTKSLLNQKRRNESPITLGKMNSPDKTRLDFYAPLLTQIRKLLIGKMARPHEVLIVQDDNGNIVKEELEESYNKELYKLMRKCLTYCTELNVNETQQIMYIILGRQVGQPRINVTELNTLAWSVGAISGAMTTDEEKIFLVHVIKQFLRLCDQRRGKDQKAVIASCIMFIVGQYPRFLDAHKRFLLTVVKKLFEFMHEPFPGVKEMAVDTFFTLARHCSHSFIIPISEESHKPPIIVEVINALPSATTDLAEKEESQFYQAVAIVISSETSSAIRISLTERLLQTPLKSWEHVVRHFNTQSNPCLLSAEIGSSAVKSLRLFCAVATGLSSNFGPILLQLSGTLMEFCVSLNRGITEKVSSNEWRGMNRDLKRNMRAKGLVLSLFEIYFRSIGEVEAEKVLVGQMAGFYEIIIKDYLGSVMDVRDHRVISLCEVLVTKLANKSETLLSDMIITIVGSTLQMINQRGDEFPEHRIKLFLLLKAVVTFCPNVILSGNQNNFNIIMSSFFWAVKHSNHDVSSLGLDILLRLMSQVKHGQLFTTFYKNNLIRILIQVLTIMSDTLHNGGFELQTEILAQLFRIINNGDITSPMYTTETGITSNREYVLKILKEFLNKQFPGRLTPEELTELLNLFMRNSCDLNAFRRVANDFLLQVKEIKTVNGFLRK